MASAALSSTPIHHFPFMNMQSFKDARTSKDLEEALLDITKQQLSRNHGMYYRELKEMDTILQGKFQEGLVSKDDNNSLIAKIMRVDQRVYNILPKDIDCQPGEKWKYQEPPISVKPHEPAPFAPLNLHSIKENMRPEAFINALRKLQESLVAQRRALTPDESTHITRCSKSAEEPCAFGLFIDPKVDEVVEVTLGISEVLK